MDAAVVAFHHIGGAELAYASALERASGAAWVRKVAVVEMHHGGRIVVRGTIAGHYVDIEGERDLIGRDTVIGAVIGVLLGLALGPPGWAAGLVAGGAVGGLRESRRVAALRGPAIDELRRDVPEGSSAVFLVADPGDVDLMLAAFTETPGRPRRHHLGPDAAEQLEAALASSPPAAPPQPFPDWP